MKLFFVIITHLVVIEVPAQAVKQPLSVHYAALGAYSSNFSDVFSGTANQASLAGLKTGAFAVFGERRFMLEALSGFTAIIAAPTPSGTIGFQADYFGASSFSESQAGVIYARKVSEQIELGAKFNYHLIRIAGYGSTSAVNFEAGAIFHITERVHTGVHVYNPGGSNLSKNGAGKLPAVYVFAVGYEASEKLYLSCELVKEVDRRVGIIAGLQYNLDPRVFIRTGISTANSISYCSVGLNVGFGRIDVNSAYHPQLGFTPGMLLLINLKKRPEE